MWHGTPKKPATRLPRCPRPQPPPPGRPRALSPTPLPTRRPANHPSPSHFRAATPHRQADDVHDSLRTARNELEDAAVEQEEQTMADRRDAFDGLPQTAHPVGLIRGVLGDVSPVAAPSARSGVPTSSGTHHGVAGGSPRGRAGAAAAASLPLCTPVAAAGVGVGAEVPPTPQSPTPAVIRKILRGPARR